MNKQFKIGDVVRIKQSINKHWADFQGQIRRIITRTNGDLRLRIFFPKTPTDYFTDQRPHEIELSEREIEFYDNPVQSFRKSEPALQGLL